MALQMQALIRDQIVDRRHKLQGAVDLLGQRPELLDLLAQVDAALSRIELGTFGLCETCHEPIESERILADPLVRFCLDHLTPTEQRALEQDLELAARIQRGLLPDVTLAPREWEIAYHYEPARVVSGDYCDVAAADGVLHFMLGDVSGKGVAASMLMANLHAMMRALISVPMPLEQLLERASRTFCESTLPTHYATMVCGRLTHDGELEIGNAGHLPPVIARNSGVSLVKATGLPVGMFCAESFTVERVRLDPGEMIVLYTDGVTEAEDADQRQYGIDRLSALVQERRALAPQALVDACISDLRAYRGPRRQDDDVTILAIRRRKD